MRTAVLGFVLVTGAGCVTQRSLGVGQMASAVGKGAADLNVFTGVMYQQQSAPATMSTDIQGDPVSNTVNSKGLSIPWFEANANLSADREPLKRPLVKHRIQIVGRQRKGFSKQIATT